jgi:AcrR family transcriptional regulator
MRNIAFEAGALLAGQQSTKREDHRTRMHDAIVMEACRLLQYEGCGSFSLRKVATGAGIPLGTLQHYFPNRSLLVGTVVKQTAASFNSAYQEIAQSSVPAAQRLTLLIEQSLRYISDRETARFMLEVTAMANHEPVVAAALADSYRGYLSFISGLIGEISRGLSARECRVRAVLIASQLEGMLIVLQSVETMCTIHDDTLSGAIQVLVESISQAS